jgi:hypothetical protein
MVDLKRLDLLEAKIKTVKELLSNIEYELDFLRNSHYRDMRDKWQFDKDLNG